MKERGIEGGGGKNKKLNEERGEEDKLVVDGMGEYTG